MPARRGHNAQVLQQFVLVASRKDVKNKRAGVRMDDKEDAILEKLLRYVHWIRKKKKRLFSTAELERLK